MISTCATKNQSFATH